MATPDTTPATIDPARLVEQLDSASILARLATLDSEHAALRVLLRAARARERRLRTEERTHAAR